MTTTTTPILVDSNIIVYAINKDSLKNKKAVEFLEDKDSFLLFAHQNVLETIRTLTHPKNPKRVGLFRVNSVIDSVISQRVIINPLGETLSIARELIDKHKLTGNKIFDAYLVATALNWGVDMIATDNEKDFRKFKQIKVFNPFK